MTSAHRPTDAASLLTAFAASWNGIDAEGIASLFTIDGDYVDFSGHWLRGRDQIRAAHRFVLEGPLAGSRIRFSDHVARALTDRAVVIHTRWQLTDIPHSTDPTGVRGGIITFTGIDADGGVAIFAGHNTQIVDSDPFSDR